MLNRYAITVSSVFILLLSFFMLPFSPLVHGTEETGSYRRKAQALQDFYGNLTSITFNFTQITRTGNRQRYGKGSAVFVKPFNLSSEGTDKDSSQQKSVMRWNYFEPDKQVIINDGTTLSIYTDKDKQLIKTSSRELDTDITYAFFAGTRNLLDDYEALPADNSFIFSSAENLEVIKFVPREPHNQIKAVQIWSDDEHVIHHLIIEDHFDSKTELNFENISINSLQVKNREEIEKIISFQVPPGTEIITQ